MSDEELAKLVEWASKHTVTAEGMKGKLEITPLEDFDPASVDIVVCGYSTPDAFRVPGAIDVECHDCEAMIILSPTSPVKPPKLCMKCAMARDNGEQSVNE